MKKITIILFALSACSFIVYEFHQILGEADIDDSVPRFVSTPPPNNCNKIDSLYRSELIQCDNWQDTLDAAIKHAYETLLGCLFTETEDSNIINPSDLKTNANIIPPAQWCDGFVNQYYVGNCGTYVSYLASLLNDLGYHKDSLMSILFQDNLGGLPPIFGRSAGHTMLLVRRKGNYYILGPAYATKVVDSSGNYKDAFEAIRELKIGNANNVKLHFFDGLSNKSLTDVYPDCSNHCAAWVTVDTIYSGIKYWIVEGDPGGYPGFLRESGKYFENLYFYYHGVTIDLSSNDSIAIKNWPYFMFLGFPGIFTVYNPGAMNVQNKWWNAIRKE